MKKTMMLSKQALLFLLIVMLFVLPSVLVIAQDDDYDDDGGEYAEEYDDADYDDEYDDVEYDDVEYDDADYDDNYDDVEYDDADYDADYDDVEYDDEYDDVEYDDEYDDVEYDDEYDDDEYDDEYDDVEYDGDYDDVEYDDEYIDEYDDEYGDFIEFEEFEDDFATGDETNPETVDGQFNVSDSMLEGNPTEAQQKLWDAYKSIIPEQWLQKISSFEVISDPETSGYVYADENDPTKFVLGLNITELGDQKELNHTVIHEFAHILTLNPEQVQGVLELGNSGSCANLQLDEGCSNQESYINQFNSQFWANQNGLENQFVSEYASTNVAEDISESFAAFVLRDKPTGTTVADQKINFFYNFPELVKMRQEIRANVAKQG